MVIVTQRDTSNKQNSTIILRNTKIKGSVCKPRLQLWKLVTTGNLVKWHSRKCLTHIAVNFQASWHPQSKRNSHILGTRALLHHKNIKNEHWEKMSPGWGLQVQVQLMFLFNIFKIMFSYCTICKHSCAIFFFSRLLHLTLPAAKYMSVAVMCPLNVYTILYRLHNSGLWVCG